MTRYDKMYVPCHPKEMDAQVIGDRFADFVEIERNKIVLTIEELSRLWNAGHSAGMEDAGATLKKPAVDFETYLKDNGINI